MLKAEATDLKLFPLYFDFSEKNKTNDIYNNALKIESVNIKKLHNLSVIKEINNLIYNYLEIKKEDRCLIDSYFTELVVRREKKAKGK